MEQRRDATERTIADLVYVGFNRRVVALDRYSGELIWQWKSPKGSGFVALLVDGDRLIASAQGYTYCLDPQTGQELWRNLLEGLGVGVPCVASIYGSTGSAAASAAIDQERAAAAAG